MQNIQFCKNTKVFTWWRENRRNVDYRCQQAAGIRGTFRIRYDWVARSPAPMTITSLPLEFAPYSSHHLSTLKAFRQTNNLSYAIRGMKLNHMQLNALIMRPVSDYPHCFLSRLQYILQFNRVRPREECNIAVKAIISASSVLGCPVLPTISILPKK